MVMMMVMVMMVMMVVIMTTVELTSRPLALRQRGDGTWVLCFPPVYARRGNRPRPS